MSDDVDDFEFILTRKALMAIKADAMRNYVREARHNPHSRNWLAEDVFRDIEDWADLIEGDS